jgi:5'-nucleotidase
MTTNRPLILITNDDGVFSPGLHAAAQAVSQLGDLIIAAPHVQQTAMGRSLPRTLDGGIIDLVTLTINGAPHAAYAVHGSPAQCVRHAVLELAPRKIDLCVSGINYGENIGAGITASGTIGATMESAAWGIPGLATSAEADVVNHHNAEYAEMDWSAAMYFTRQFAALLLARGLPEEIALLNLNIPSSATIETPVKVTAQSRHSYFVASATPRNDYSTTFQFSYGPAPDRGKIEPDSDIQAFFVDRVVTITPMSLDMTARVPLDQWYQDFVGRS